MIATMTTRGPRGALPGHVTKRVEPLAKRPGVHFYQGGEIWHCDAQGRPVRGRMV